VHARDEPLAATADVLAVALLILEGRARRLVLGLRFGGGRGLLIELADAGRDPYRSRPALPSVVFAATSVFSTPSRIRFLPGSASPSSSFAVDQIFSERSHSWRTSVSIPVGNRRAAASTASRENARCRGSIARIPTMPIAAALTMSVVHPDQCDVARAWLNRTAHHIATSVVTPVSASVTSPRMPVIRRRARATAPPRRGSVVQLGDIRTAERSHDRREHSPRQLAVAERGADRHPADPPTNGAISVTGCSARPSRASRRPCRRPPDERRVIAEPDVHASYQRGNMTSRSNDPRRESVVDRAPTWRIATRNASTG
jgi:hypothetical protein